MFLWTEKIFGILLEKILSRDSENRKLISSKNTGKERNDLMSKIVEDLQIVQDTMQKRFSGWTNIQDGIAGGHKAIEFRRAGSIRYNLYTRDLGSEKAVDIKLATDLIRLKDIYELAS